MKRRVETEDFEIGKDFEQYQRGEEADELME